KAGATLLRQFARYAQPAVQSRLDDPSDARTFDACKLDFAERELHAGVYRLHRDLLRLRRETPAFRAQRRHGVDGAVLGPEALLLRFFHAEGDRLLLLNLGPDVRLASCSDPLIAPPIRYVWQIIWSSDETRYGGDGTAPFDAADVRVPAHALLVLAPVPSTD